MSGLPPDAPCVSRVAQDEPLWPQWKGIGSLADKQREAFTWMLQGRLHPQHEPVQQPSQSEALSGSRGLKEPHTGPPWVRTSSPTPQVGSRPGGGRALLCLYLLRWGPTSPGLRHQSSKMESPHPFISERDPTLGGQGSSQEACGIQGQFSPWQSSCASCHGKDLSNQPRGCWKRGSGLASCRPGYQGGHPAEEISLSLTFQRIMKKSLKNQTEWQVTRCLFDTPSLNTVNACLPSAKSQGTAGVGHRERQGGDTDLGTLSRPGYSSALPGR